ncbi:LytTR family transcriptional regulator [Cohnella pontilimi]|uniref:LytTR family transcriptional regulator n=1 Tax=Cohnella pontilimi TaxID=2564100 RepID=A0A4U0F330_9BACL|nr:LytTR family DNA-binding domain-containing protein [Cohnella pontilimi]TJY38936.1 LytTR family transcriptional regulator [Cohnella pontilimi]
MDWDGNFSLMVDSEGQAGFRTIHADDILFFCVQQNQIIAHTLEEELFTGWYSLDRLWQALKLSDPRFYRTDRVYIVNLSKIKKLDREWGKIYFTEDPGPTSKHCYVARLKLSEVQSRITSLAAEGLS